MVGVFCLGPKLDTREDIPHRITLAKITFVQKSSSKFETNLTYLTMLIQPQERSFRLRILSHL